MLAKGRKLFLDVKDDLYKKGFFDELVTYFSSSAMFGVKGPENLRKSTEKREIGLGWILYGFIRAIKPEIVVEVGAGGSSICILWGLRHNNKGELHTIDSFLWGEDWECLDGKVRKSSYVTFMDAIESLKFQDICHFYHDTSENIGRMLNTPIDMLVVDGDHRLEAVKLDFELFMPFLKPGGYAFFHDLLACPDEIGIYLQSQCTSSSEYVMMVEPDYLSMGIIQKKFTLNYDGLMETQYQARAENKLREDTSVHLTDARGNADILFNKWNGKWFSSLKELQLAKDRYHKRLKDES